MTDLLRKIGRYHVERLIAHGGMGSLYLARDPAIDRLVAIKVLKEGFDDAAARERFAREARAAGRLHHPNIVTIFDVGEHDDRPFIAMEYVAGETLAQLIGRRAVGPVWERLAILEDLCAGLHYAHCASIVHRDIKPANVMLDGTGLVKILDFGIARHGGGALTGAGDIVGTLNYMSPEQLAGGPVDHRTDVYSVGAVGYELITGQMAFPGTIQTGVLFNIFNRSPVPIESLVPGTDPDITAMIERAMARDPVDRYDDLDTLREDLATVRTRLLESAPDPGGIADSNAETRFESPRIASDIRSRPSSSRIRSARRTGAVPMLTPSGRSRVRRNRYRTLAIVAGCVVLAVALTAILVFDPFSKADPAVGTEPISQAQPSAAPAAVPPPVPADAPDEKGSERDEQVNQIRLTARQQIALGDREQALGTLTRGLAIAADDPELNRLFDELASAARRSAADARNAAVGRGARERSSAAFRQGEARERDAERLLRAGDRVEGIRAALSATALYRKAPEPVNPKASAGPPADAPTKPADKRIEPAAPPPGNPPIPTSPAVEPIKTVPGAGKGTGTPLPPPTAPKPAPAPVAREAESDPRAADLGAIREVLRRYVDAYESLNAAAVGKVMPSLTSRQLRDLERDFSAYRRYNVDITNERIAVDGATATVTCHVVRSFETKNGVEGSNAIPTVFHFRRTAAGWTIERLQSR